MPNRTFDTLFAMSLEFQKVQNTLISEGKDLNPRGSIYLTCPASVKDLWCMRSKQKCAEATRSNNKKSTVSMCSSKTLRPTNLENPPLPGDGCQDNIGGVESSF